MPRISHMLVLTDKAQLNSGLIELLKSSYQRSHQAADLIRHGP
jgi:hypothetical protein